MKFEEKPTFNLGVVVQETGIHPDTLRAWERRYGLPSPERSEGGHRLYSREDIRTVKWLLERQEEGMRIGQAVDLWRELRKAGRDPFQRYPLNGEGPASLLQPGDGRQVDGEGERLDSFRQAWLQAGFNYDETTADEVFTAALARFPVEIAAYEILLKGLRVVGEKWYRGEISVPCEHFVSSLAEKRVQALLAGLPSPVHDQQIVLACAPGEWHTFSLLLVRLFLRRQGHPVRYLGAAVPAEDLVAVLRSAPTALVILSAHMLSTAGRLYPLLKGLVARDIPVGYGGGIFTQVPDLREVASGYFLGEDIRGIDARVKRVLQDPELALAEGQGIPVKFPSWLEGYQKAQSKIKGGVYRSLIDQGLEGGGLEIAVENISAGIVASLTLGDLGYLAHPISWVKGWLSHRGLPSHALSTFLDAYGRGVRRALGEEGEALSEWLRGKATEMR